VEVEPTEPAIGKMQLDFLAELALRADTVAVGDDQHPDHQLGINRGPAHLAVEGFKLVTKMGQYLRYGRIDPAQKMAIRNSIFQIEKIEQLALIDRLPPHHDPPPPLTESSGSESWFAGTHEPFFNSIGHKQTKRPAGTLSALPPKADIYSCPLRSLLCANSDL